MNLQGTITLTIFIIIVSTMAVAQTSPQLNRDPATVNFAGYSFGIDIRAGDRIDVRIIQVDYIPARLFGSSARNVRVGLGLAFH